METGPLLEITHVSAGAIDREAGVIRDVKILGRTSANNRRYTESAIQGAVKLYEGVSVNVDHPSFKNLEADRTVADRLGWLQGVKATPDGLRGDMHFLKSHPIAGQICEAAERRPELLGLSHNAVGRFERQKGGGLIIEEILRVRSVDLVSDPATTNGLFESKDQTVKRTIREIAASTSESVFGVKLLREAIEPGAPMAAAADAPVETTPEATPESQVKAAFRAAVMAAFDDESLDTKATLKKIADVLKAYEKLSGESEKTETDEPVSDAAGTAVAAESKLQSRLAHLEARDVARNLLESKGVSAVTVEQRQAQINAIANLDTEKDRLALLETWQATEPGHRPRSGAPIGTAPQGADLPKNGKEFANAIL